MKSTLFASALASACPPAPPRLPPRRRELVIEILGWATDFRIDVAQEALAPHIGDEGGVDRGILTSKPLDRTSRSAARHDRALRRGEAGEGGRRRNPSPRVEPQRERLCREVPWRSRSCLSRVRVRRRVAQGRPAERRQLATKPGLRPYAPSGSAATPSFRGLSRETLSRERSRGGRLVPLHQLLHARRISNCPEGPDP